MTTRLTRVGAAAGAAMLIASLGAGSVFAGEVTGTDDPTGTQGKSWCRFSGLNDRVEGDGPVEPRTQTYGIELGLGLVPHPSISKGGAPSPGTMCNPERTFLPPLK